MITKPKEKSLSVLIKEADEVFSKYIRNKYSVDGYCYCFICSTRLKISEAQNGHFIDRDQMATRYDERNCHPVCHYCNCVDPDHGYKYTWMMYQIYGEEELDRLRVKSKSLQKFMRHELEDLIADFKERIKSLKK